MKYYVVWDGRAPGIYDSWEECQEQISGYPGAKYKSFPTLDIATEAFRSGDKDPGGIIRAIAAHEAEKINYDAFPEIRQVSLAVDAACAKNPGPVEYRGVWVATGQEVFRVGPLPGGSNNLGEFLALIHGAAYLQKIGHPEIPIYTDSRTARSWLRNRKIKTTLARTAENRQIFDLLDRAMVWLNTHSIPNEILEWDTPRWGEIPADFGRKRR